MIRKTTVAAGFLLASSPAFAMPMTVKGSTTIAPFVREAAAEYGPKHNLMIKVVPVPSAEGIKCAKDNSCDLGLASRALEENESDGIEKTLLGWEGFAFVVHPSNPIQSLNKGQIKDLICGKVDNWKEIGGKDLPVKVYNRGESTGLGELFEKTFKCKPKGVATPETGAVYFHTKSEEGAISFVGLGRATQEQGLKLVSYEKIEPSVEKVRDGAYPLKRDLLLLRPKGKTNPAIDGFVQYLLESREKLFPKLGFISAK